MSVLVTQHADNLFSVIVSDSKDRPADLIAGVKQCPKRSIKALFIAPSFHTAGWEQALAAIAPRLRPGLAVSHYEAAMGDTIIALPAAPAGPVPMPYPNVARSDTNDAPTIADVIKISGPIFAELRTIYAGRRSEGESIVLKTLATFKTVQQDTDNSREK